jgi:hypothetical protein
LLSTAVGPIKAVSTLAGGVAGAPLAGSSADHWSLTVPMLLDGACCVTIAALSLALHETAPAKSKHIAAQVALTPSQWWWVPEWPPQARGPSRAQGANHVKSGWLRRHPGIKPDRSPLTTVAQPGLDMGRAAASDQGVNRPPVTDFPTTIWLRAPVGAPPRPRKR